MGSPPTAGRPTTSAPDEASVVMKMPPVNTAGLPGHASSALSSSVSGDTYAMTAASSSSLAGAGGGGADALNAEGRSSASEAFPDWQRPSAGSSIATAACELLTWGALLGVGIPLENFKVGGMIAAGVALLGVAMEIYRKVWETSVRIWPKVHSAITTCTWVVNGVFCAGVSRATAQRYCLMLVMSGLVLAGGVSLALNRAMDGATPEEEKNHPIFQRCCRRISWGLFVLNLLQWPCFFVVAVFVRDEQDSLILLLLLLPVGMLVAYALLVCIYGQIERALLEEALRTGVDSSEGMDVVTVVYGRFRSLLPCLHRKNPGQQEEGDENDLGKEEGGS